MIPTTNFIADFLSSFDPDSLRDCLGLLDDGTRDEIRSIIEPSPKTEQEWIDVSRAHRLEADALFASLNYKLPPRLADRAFILSYDWAWHSSDYPIELMRYEVYALRTALELPTHEGSWSEWCRRNSHQIAETGLTPWIFESRTRWYAYLRGGTIPWYRFEDCPRPENLLLNTEAHYNDPSVLELLARIRLIQDNHPNYFFNVRCRLMGQLNHAWGIHSYR